MNLFTCGKGPSNKRPMSKQKNTVNEKGPLLSEKLADEYFY